MKMEEVITAYETHDEVITKYNSLVEAHGGNSAVSKTNLLKTRSEYLIGKGNTTG